VAGEHSTNSLLRREPVRIEIVHIRDHANVVSEVQGYLFVFHGNAHIEGDSSSVAELLFCAWPRDRGTQASKRSSLEMAHGEPDPWPQLANLMP